MMIHLVLFLMLIIVSVVAVAAAPESKQPVGFGRPLISRRKWSSTGMGGLDHHDPEVPIEEVELVSKKSKIKSEDPSGVRVHPGAGGECS
jgi:hypothetical protein